MRRLSLNARLARDAEASAEIEVALFIIEHPELEEPIRLSTDNTERLSDDPYTMGTRSTWRGSDPLTQPFLWVIASAVLPGEAEDAPATATLVLDNLSSEMVELLRSFTEPATIHIAGVLASSPDDIEVEQLDLQIVSAEVNAGEITLQISREDMDLEPFPPGRMTRMHFPGLHL
jgi:hypothetical protein